MSRVFAWPFLLSLVAGVGSATLVRYLWSVRDRPGARWFLVTVSFQTLFCFAYAGALLVPDETLRYALEVVTVASLCWIGPSFLAFALEYTGRSRYLRSWYLRSFFGLSLVVTLLLPLNPSLGLFWTGFETEPVLGVVGATYVNQPLLFVAVLGGASGAALGSVILFETFFSYGPLYRSEAVAVAVSPVPPAAGILVWLFDLGPVPALNLTAVLFLPHVLFDAYAFVGNDMFEFHPATRRAAERSALDDLGSAVLVLDEQGRVVDLNERARSALPVEDPVTEPVESALGTAVALDEDQRLTLRSDGHQREFRVRPAPLTDSGDNHVGYTLLFEDITEEVQREQRLGVLNRVLRHNLRNDMTVVKGNVAVAREESDDASVTEPLVTAESTANDLVETSEKARTVAETIRTDGDPVRVPVTQLCRTVVDRVRVTNPAASVAVEGEDVSVATDRQLLTTVVKNLVENALEHGGEAPSVTVAVDASSPDRVRITVADDGPGIPEEELAAIRTGEETDLQHGSGFGLWVVKWGAERLGDVTFETGEVGTTATLSVVDQRATDASQTSSPSA